MHKILMNTIEQ